MKKIERYGIRLHSGLRLVIAMLTLMQLSACALAVVGGVAGGAIVASDRRQASVMLDDQRIESKATDIIYSDPLLTKKVHANVTSYNHVLLLTGEVVSDELKKRVVDIVSNISDVKLVHNELVVANLADFSERSSDSWLTSKVKARMLGAKDINGGHVKVVSESSTVYLMGLVTPLEANSAAKIASETKGVERVVTLFEFVDPASVEKEAPPSTPKLQKI